MSSFLHVNMSGADNCVFDKISPRLIDTNMNFERPVVMERGGTIKKVEMVLNIAGLS